MIKKEDKPEFIGQIMDLFEDFLDEYKGDAAGRRQ